MKEQFILVNLKIKFDTESKGERRKFCSKLGVFSLASDGRIERMLHAQRAFIMGAPDKCYSSASLFGTIITQLFKTIINWSFTFRWIFRKVTSFVKCISNKISESWSSELKVSERLNSYKIIPVSNVPIFQYY